MRVFSLCTGHAFQLQFLCLNNFLLSFIFCKPWKHQKKKKKKEKNESAALEMLDSSDSPCVTLFF